MITSQPTSGTNQQLVEAAFNVLENSGVPVSSPISSPMSASSRLPRLPSVPSPGSTGGAPMMTTQSSRVASLSVPKGTGNTVVVASTVPSVSSAIKQVSQGIAGDIGSLGSSVGSSFQSIGSGVGSGLQSLGQGVGSGLQSLGQGVGSGLQSFGQGVGSGIQSVSQGAGSSVSQLGSSVSSGFQSIGQGVGSAVREVTSGLSSVGQSIGGGLSTLSQPLEGMSSRLSPPAQLTSVPTPSRTLTPLQSLTPSRTSLSPSRAPSTLTPLVPLTPSRTSLSPSRTSLSPSRTSLSPSQLSTLTPLQPLTPSRTSLVPSQLSTLTPLQPLTPSRTSLSPLTQASRQPSVPSLSPRPEVSEEILSPRSVRSVRSVRRSVSPPSGMSSRGSLITSEPSRASSRLSPQGVSRLPTMMTPTTLSSGVLSGTTSVPQSESSPSIPLTGTSSVIQLSPKSPRSRAASQMSSPKVTESKPVIVSVSVPKSTSESILEQKARSLGPRSLDQRIDSALFEKGYVIISVVELDDGSVPYVQAYTSMGDIVYIKIDKEGTISYDPASRTIVSVSPGSNIPHAMKVGTADCASSEVCGVMFSCGKELCTVNRKDDGTYTQTAFVTVSKPSDAVMTQAGSPLAYPVLTFVEIENDNADAIRRARTASEMIQRNATVKSIQKFEDIIAKSNALTVNLNRLEGAYTAVHNARNREVATYLAIRDQYEAIKSSVIVNEDGSRTQTVLIPEDQVRNKTLIDRLSNLSYVIGQLLAFMNQYQQQINEHLDVMNTITKDSYYSLFTEVRKNFSDDPALSQSLMDATRWNLPEEFNNVDLIKGTRGGSFLDYEGLPVPIPMNDANVKGLLHSLGMNQ